MTGRLGGRTRVGALSIVVALVVLTGCGDTDPEKTKTTSAGGLTAPGSSLEMGQTATLPLENKSDVIELAVTGIEQGDPSALKGLEGTPYYVRLEATAVAGDAYQFFVDTYVGAWARETRVPGIATPLKTGPCERTYFAYNVQPGVTLKTCLTFVVEPGGAAIDRVAFENGEGYEFDNDTAVAWR